MMRKHIPNLLTLCNALCGAIGIYYATHGYLVLALWLMLGSALFDFFDGFAARALHAPSPLGKDLDSLADAISFGVLPAMMMVVALQSIQFVFPLVALLIVPATVYRLAKFNNDTRQTSSFIGLPSPANALFFSGLAVWIFQEQEMLLGLPRMIQYKVYGLFVVLTVLWSYLLISELPMFGLKSKEKGRAFYLSLSAVVVAGVVGAVLRGYLGLSVAIFTYILVNILPVLKRSALR